MRLRTPPPSPAALARDYGLDVVYFEEHHGGFESSCWVLDRTWFVKMWRDTVPARLALLEDLRERGLPVVAPVPTAGGELSASAGGRAYAVFPFVAGRTAEKDDWAETASALRRVHEITDLDLPRTTMAEPDIDTLRDRLDHPWIADRRGLLVDYLDRLDEVISRASSIEVPHVLCHLDFGGFNLLLDHQGRTVAILDWDQAVLAPCEHDVWIAAEGPHLREFLDAYGPADLNLSHLEYALLARALRDLTARVGHEVDRAGVDTWGFARLARLDTDLAAFRAYCTT